MGALRRYWEIVKMIFMYIKFKFRQYQLKTNENVVVDTVYGPVKGVKRFSCWKDQFYSFEKIPFAKPPLGELRFKAPQPPEKWTEVKDCTKEGPAPLQFNLFIERVEGSEDCLYLNVYSKNINPTEPLPVMVWIYGGGFEMGGTSKDLYSPDYFMQKDIVLISITYRVGPFGFLSLEDPKLDVPGNAGLKDQVLALKWVKNNCSRFGGDTNNITVFGESAGAASTHYMMLTEHTKDLFHKAILMSGCSVAPWANVPPRNWAYRLAKQLGYDDIDNDEKIYKFLKNSKGTRILDSEKQILSLEERRNHYLFPFGPVVEPFVTDHCVVPEAPVLMMRKAWSADIPVLIGGTSFEGLIFMKGFLSFNDPTIGIPGNAGLKDQILALKWIKENVSRFGGDVDNITLFGESAGSVSVHYLTLINQTAGLFHKAILMSGTVLCPWAKQNVTDLPHRAAKFAGYNGSTNEKEIYAYLKNAKGLDLVCIGEKLLNKEEMRNRLLLAYGPVVEPYKTDDCVVPEEPRLMLKKAWGNKIPILIGCTADEGLLFYKQKKDIEMLDELGNCEYMVPLELGLDRKSDLCKEFGLKIKEAHYGNRYANHYNFKEYMDLMKYKMFWHGNHRTCLARLKYSSARTFLYRFDVDSPDFNVVRKIFAGKTVRGVCHGDDLGYIFHNMYAKNVKSGSLEYKSIQRMVNMWTSFAKKGNPNDDIILPVVWSPLNSTNSVMKCLNIGNELEFIDLPEASKLEIWDSIYDPETLF